jgi:rod shape determining protein RodA
MNMRGSIGKIRVDWVSIGLYLLLVFVGWINIYSSTVTENHSSIFDFSTIYGKQLFFIGISLCAAGFIFIVNTKAFERFTAIYYFTALLLLIGLFVFGKTIAGATSWYNLGFFNFQPSELAKIATALALAKYLSDIQTDIKKTLHAAIAFAILLIPALLVIPQPDPGSALVFFALSFVLFREGFSLKLFWGVFGAILLFIAVLKWGVIWSVGGLVLGGGLGFILKPKRIKWSWTKLGLGILTSVVFATSVNYVFNGVFEQRHRDRFSLWLDLEKDPEVLEKINRSIGYNTYQSTEAIRAGGFFGKGFLEGTRTKGDFVPEQHSDYIFSTLGEEWGFVGTTGVVLLFTALLLRLLFLSERQSHSFNRIFGYGVVSILGIHYIINIGMVLGLLPTIGIPLPYLSYGGSGMLGFTLLLFIFLKLDGNRLKEWD